jgi:hypothetical protein
LFVLAIADSLEFRGGYQPPTRQGELDLQEV